MIDSPASITALESEYEFKSAEFPPPVCFSNESDVSYQLVFNLRGAQDSKLHAYMSSDQKRLHVVIKKETSESTIQALWIFVLPADSDVNAITVDRTSDIYMLEIPKRTFWARLRRHLPVPGHVLEHSSQASLIPTEPMHAS